MMSESDSFCENQSNFDDLRNIDDFATTAIPLHCEPNADEKLEEPSQIRSVKPIEEGCEHIDRNVKTGGILKKNDDFFSPIIMQIKRSLLCMHLQKLSQIVIC
jgi:hypothetical protein